MVVVDVVICRVEEGTSSDLDNHLRRLEADLRETRAEIRRLGEQKSALEFEEEEGDMPRAKRLRLRQVKERLTQLRNDITELRNDILRTEDRLQGALSCVCRAMLFTLPSSLQPLPPPPPVSLCLFSVWVCRLISCGGLLL